MVITAKEALIRMKAGRRAKPMKTVFIDPWSPLPENTSNIKIMTLEEIKKENRNYTQR